MKKYIIIGNITGIGGWQLYVNSRYGYMTESGINTFVLYPDNEDGSVLKLSNSKDKKVNGLKELRYPPLCYSKRQIKNVLNRICRLVEYEQGDEVFIESTCIDHSMWGEILAKRVSGTHFAYLLHSHIDNMSNERQEYFAFKYKQQLLAGQSDNTLPDLFKNYMDIPLNDTRAIPAVWDDPIVDFKEDCLPYITRIREYKNTEYRIIGYFGTLNKPHFSQLCDKIVEYSKIRNSRILFVAIGSSNDGTSEKRLLDVYEEGKVEVLNIPETYPIAKVVFQILDVCLASWGSATVAARACHRTIRLMNDTDIIPQGIIGITLKNKPYYKQPIGDETLFELFDNILFGENYKSIDYDEPDKYVSSPIGHRNIDLQMRPFEKREDSGIYYEVSRLHCIDWKERRIKFLINLLGVEGTFLLRRLTGKAKQ